ncbi:baseplate J/gp47 family protein [Secundilactobacillus kimchicus]|uniref:baseplate J/gp47 family protein n=1 Tax=Secundilactobacillus kimchicus TaxID=528209 RepID=UPI0024A7EC8B|nr:baseplate J/gp47 family protein [Secundilactobacillus kimchicus]
MPVTEKGDYERPEIDDIREKVNEIFISQFGNTLDNDDDQTPGLIEGVWSMMDDELEQLSQAIVNSMFLLKQQGYQIDDTGREIGLYRHAASYASVQLQIDGYIDPDSPTIIPIGSQFSTADGQIFETVDPDVSIINQATVKGENGTEIPLVDDDGNALGRVMISARADESGTESNVMPSSVVNAEQSIDGFYAVTNPNGATGGSDTETDNEFKLRIMKNRTHSKGSNKNSIEIAVLNVEGVKDARLINNCEMVADQYGNPAKSIHLYVIGGDDQAIAEAYFTAIHSLAKTIGDVSKTVVDVGGKSNQINFDRAKTIPVYVDIEATIDNNTFDLDNGANTIKQNVLAYFDTLTMGSPVLYSKLFGPVYGVQGIQNVSITLGIDKSKLVAADTTVNNFELAVTSKDYITVNVTNFGGA